MRVGVNYPWFDYGWDFGTPPPGWRDREGPRWADHLDAHLERFLDLGIRVVRWFVLGDGLTYGAGANAPHLDVSGRAPRWRFEPPALDDAFLADFGALLERFARVNGAASTDRLALLPVLVDFKTFEPGMWPVADTGWVKGGRADVVNEDAARQAFLERVLQPLLTVSQSVPPETLYAWEVMNEPEWITSGWHPHVLRRWLPVEGNAMRSFLEDAAGRIRQAGFKATIGFARVETIARTGLYADVNQFHHYTRGSRRLRRHKFSSEHPAILGEFATSSAEDRWPELEGTDQRVLNRLRTADRLGYPLALPWSFRAQDRCTSWNLTVEQDIACFTRDRDCPDHP
jgi:hypothetical protein